ncbi:MAG: hypothetical protein BWK77_08580 [Verrucomicrobia bacterium A1]|nr:MAG: hypothetical protein BWK77_08580 [Verrucomicrobia bacterium A1]
MKLVRLILLAVLGFTAAPAANAVEDGAAKLAIWCEFMPYRDVLKTLPALGRYHCDLLLHVGRNDIGSPDLSRVYRDAEAEGVEVIAWFLLPYDEHLYVGEGSVESTRALALDFADWATREHLPARQVVFDCEPSPLLGRRLFAEVRRYSLLGLAQELRSEMDPAAFASSVESLNGLIDELHARDLQVMGAANRVFLDFLDRGNTTFQDALNAPFTMIHWDRASFITYRYKAPQEGYIAMVNRYATLSRRFFGERAALDLGLLGDQRGMPEHLERAELFGGGDSFRDYLDGIRSVYDLQDAVGVALACGVRNINLYSLDGAVGSVAGLERWLRAASESRAAGGLARWTPVRSATLGAFSGLLNGLFASLVDRPFQRRYSRVPTM